MKNILVTGGLGYIGINISNLLLKSKKYNCIIVDNLSNSSLKKLKILKKINKKKPIFIKKNIGSNEIYKIFKNNKIDSVIHCAASKSVGESLKNPELYYENNISNFISLLKIMNSYNCKKLIFSSTAAVYDHKKKPPYNENSVIDPDNTYGLTKIIGENLVKDFAVRTKNFRFMILRYFNPIGTDEEGVLGDDPLFPENIIPRVVSSINKKEVFNIYGNNYKTKDGTCYRDYIDIRDIAKAHIYALEKINKFKNETFNIGTGISVSVRDILNYFELNKKIKINYKIAKKRDGDYPFSLASVKKSQKLLKFKAKFSIKNSIENIIKHQVK